MFPFAHAALYCLRLQEVFLEAQDRNAGKFCNHYPPCVEVWKSGCRVNKYIGYDAGETRRIQHAAAIDEADKKYEKHYPLYEWGWDRAECVRVIERPAAKAGQVELLLLPVDEKERNSSVVGEQPGAFSAGG